MHWTINIDALAEKSWPPKFRPVTVTEDPPLLAELRSAFERSGASKENGVAAVPETAATVTKDG
jgi:hypothetical protein